MLKNWKVAHKIMLMPALSALALLVIVLMAPRAVSENQELMTLIETGHFPASELTRNLHQSLADIQRRNRSLLDLRACR